MDQKGSIPQKSGRKSGGDNHRKCASAFAERVYAYCAKVPQGKVTTYGEIARLMGIKGYQAIGQALRCNPYAPQVPCHRVVCSDGRLGGFMGKRSGPELFRKESLLRAEGVVVEQGRVDLEKYFFSLGKHY